MFQDNRNFEPGINARWVIHEVRHASAILRTDFPQQWADILGLLETFHLGREDVAAPGGSKSRVSQKIEAFMNHRGWAEHQFSTQIAVEGVLSSGRTHLIDCYKGTTAGGVALEIEWNNKDPFFDRDLNNFRRLHEIAVLSVGVIVTRATEATGALNAIRPGNFSTASTHTAKLLPKLESGGAGACPVLVFGITSKHLEEASE